MLPDESKIKALHELIQLYGQKPKRPPIKLNIKKSNKQIKAIKRGTE